MYQILNGIQAMGLEPGSTIVEVGSGAGWVTELLAGLRYRVECVEPAELMVDAAQERVAAFLKSHAMDTLVENVAYHRTTFEEAELGTASADAVLFFESFHHMIDEHAAVGKCARVLRPGGVVCILGDSNWVPGYHEQEAFWIEEMERFGTLESPFTHDYLVALFEHYGFGDVTRHHGVNGLVPKAREQEPVVEFAGHLNATYVNLVTARKSAAS